MVDCSWNRVGLPLASPTEGAGPPFWFPPFPWLKPPFWFFSSKLASSPSSFLLDVHTCSISTKEKFVKTHFCLPALIFTAHSEWQTKEWDPIQRRLDICQKIRQPQILRQKKYTKKRVIFDIPIQHFCCMTLEILGWPLMNCDELRWTKKNQNRKTERQKDRSKKVTSFAGGHLTF